MFNTAKASREVKRQKYAMKRKQWSDEQMIAAKKAVEQGSSTREAARNHGIPYSTLQDQVKGRVKHGVNPGPKPYLNVEEEAEFGTFLKNCASLGYGKTRRDVLHIVEAVAKDKGVLKKENVSHGWWAQFLQRQGDLSLRHGDSTATVSYTHLTLPTIYSV